MFKVKKLEVDAAHNLIAMLMEEDAKELGLHANDRIRITNQQNHKSIICELEIVDFVKRWGNHKDINLKIGEIGIFEHAFEKLEIEEDKRINLIPAEKPKSIEYVRKKFLGEKLNEEQFLEIMKDIVENKYSDIETTFFVLACSTHKLDIKETIAITNAMVKVGRQLDFKKDKNDIIVDKHCIGGVPGNRTTMIIVPIIAAAGLKIPKTSSRSITSPAGTADTMEVFANVQIPLSKMHEIVNNNKGCIIWGGAFDLSPADDLIIHVEHPLRLDFEVQMIASILSKKKAAGSTHVLIDIPYGEQAKVTSRWHAYSLKRKFKKVGKAIGLTIEVIITDGSEPIGNGLGPLQEAKDVLKVLKNQEDAPKDLLEKGLIMAGHILEMSKTVKKGLGYEKAKQILVSGKAFEKFEEIIKLQGKKQITPDAKFSIDIPAFQNGKITKINNRRLSKIAFMLGAPKDKAAGLIIHKKLNQTVGKEDVVYTLYSNSKLKLKYAMHYIEEKEIITIR